MKASKLIFTLVVLVLQTHVAFGQTIDYPNDSLKNIKTEVASKTDSLNKNINRKVFQNKDSLKSKIISAFKGSGNQFSDSSLKSGVKTEVSLIGYSVSKPDSLKSNLMKKLKPNFSGSLINETYATNYIDPFSRNEKVYNRLYGNPSIDILGLPFNLDFFLTTENNSFYNSNYLTLDFDFDKYKQKLQQKAQQKINAQIEAKQESVKSLMDVTKDKQIALKEIRREKQNLARLAASTSSLEKYKYDQWLDQQKRKTNSHVDYDSIQIIRGGEQLIMDSMTNYKSYQQYHDSLIEINRKIDRWEARYKETEQLYEKYKKYDEVLNDSLTKLKNEYASKDYLYKKGKELPLYQKAQKIISVVDKFRLGLTNPVYSDYSLNGVPVKGYDIGLNIKSNKLDITSGRTFRTEYNTFGSSQPRPAFDRNVIGLKWTQNFNTNHSISIASVSLFDMDTVSNKKRNLLHTIEFNHLILGTELFVSLNHSYLNEKPNLISESVDPFGTVIKINNLERFYDHLALEAQINKDIGKNLGLEGNFKRLNPSFVTLGNPYLRSNFEEFNFKLKAKLFKRKVRVTSFYKDFKDNITQLSSSTNTMSGYGVSAQSNFKGPLNFFAQHSPYQQGNNNPDTLFRTDNQLAVTTGTLMYTKKFKNTFLTATLTYVNSKVDYNRGSLLVDNSMLMQTFGLSNKKISGNFSLSRNITGPVVDTLNFWGYRLSLVQQNGKKVNFSISTFYDQFDVGSYRHRTTLTGRFNLTKKLVTDLSAEMGEVYQLYGVQEQNIFGCRMLLRYQF